MKRSLLTILFSTAMFAASGLQAATILGTGAGALIGGDRTDPENNGSPDANVGYNALFRSSSEPGFGGGEFAFNVFDNQVGGGNAKWCCGDTPGSPQWVDAQFSQPIQLTNFTVTSSNDSPQRDPVNWEIQGSNDGTNFTTIFSQAGNGTVWTARNQVIEWSIDDGDFAAPAHYSYIRFNATSTGASSGAFFALNEIEIFGVPSTGSTLPMLLLGAGAIAATRRKLKKTSSR